MPTPVPDPVPEQVTAEVTAARGKLLTIFTDLHDCLALLAHVEYANAGTANNPRHPSKVETGARAAFARAVNRSADRAADTLAQAREHLAALGALTDPAPRYAGTSSDTPGPDAPVPA